MITFLLCSLLHDGAFALDCNHQKLDEEACPLFIRLILGETEIHLPVQNEGLCQTLHIIHWMAEACFQAKRCCFYSLAHRWSFTMTHNPPPPQPSGFSCQVPLSQVLLLCFVTRDWGRVIVTVPALGCPEVSRWDLTRHGLSSLPYSPDAGSPVGKGVTEGGEIIGCRFSLFHPNICQDNCGGLFLSLCSTVLLKKGSYFYSSWQ